MRIPVRIEDDDRICRLQVQAQPTGARGQEKDEVIRFRLAEFRQKFTTLFGFRLTVQTKVRKI